jgi:SAM-dependent methyltransferase
MAKMVPESEDRHSSGAFDPVAEQYDRWYDSPEGAPIYAAEVSCLLSVFPSTATRWLEVGVGTGRFARALNVKLGIDPSPAMVTVAARRGIRTVRAIGEGLPCRTGAFDGVLMVASLCFISDPVRALEESRRVMCPGGWLLIGHIPADGPWGRAYIEKGRTGHPVYSHARFTTVNELESLVAAQGFTLRGAASALFWSPEGTPEEPARIEQGIVQGAGFVALPFTAA